MHFGIPKAYNGWYNNCKSTCVSSYNIHKMDCNLTFKAIKGFVKQLFYMVDNYVHKIDVHNMGTSNRDVIDGDE